LLTGQDEVEAYNMVLYKSSNTLWGKVSGPCCCPGYKKPFTNPENEPRIKDSWYQLQTQLPQLLLKKKNILFFSFNNGMDETGSKAEIGVRRQRIFHVVAV
jgi:hypothetical protein